MFEAKLKECITLKKIVDSIKDIVSDVNLEITPNCMLFILLLIFVFLIFICL